MSRLERTSLADVGRWFGRFGPYVALVVTVVLVVGFLPGTDNGGNADDEDFGLVSGDVSTDTGDTAGGDLTTSGDQAELDTGGGDVTGGGDTGGDSGDSGPSRQVTLGPIDAAGMVWNCDPNTGRIKVPSKHAPPCVPAYDGNNGGATYKGVTADKIKVAVYRGQSNPAADAILAAAGADDSDEESKQQYHDWADFYESHYETYGRKVEIHFVDASGPSSDDAAGRADAVRVAEEIGAFASWGYLNNAYIDELAARGVMCMECAIQQPMEYYQSRAPYVWSTLMMSTSLYSHLVELMVNQLHGKKAEFAGDLTIASKNRAWGLLWYETPDGAYKKGTEFFIRELAKHGIKLTAEAAFRGYPDLAANQEQARPIIQKMKNAGATTLIMAADPFAPIFFSQEATRQQYFPEWIVTGSALTDTTFFARTYDQQQWSNAFGLGVLNARLPQEKGESYRLLQWHFGRGPTAKAGYAVIRAGIDIFYKGVHMAGERLNPKSFQAGLFSIPVSGAGGFTMSAVSFGRQVFPYDDYTVGDDVTYIWWDPQARGEDEIGNDGVGMYRYVEGGKRHLPGKHPTATNWFDPAGTVLVYDDPPPGDKPPDYPHEHRK